MDDGLSWGCAPAPIAGAVAAGGGCRTASAGFGRRRGRTGLFDGTGAATRDDGQVVRAAAPHSCRPRVRVQYGSRHGGSSMCGPRRHACSPLLRAWGMRAAGPDDARDSARTFACARCGVQVLVCRRCDRGQRYCGDGCACPARRESQRMAARRYQHGRAGRFAHARRARRYRQRRGQQKNVTHQGSQALGERATVAQDPPATPGVAAGDGNAPAAWHCQWCARACAPVLRRGFLRRGRVPVGCTTVARGSVHGQSP